MQSHIPYRRSRELYYKRRVPLILNGDYIFNIYRTVYYMFEKKYKLLKVLGEGTFGKVYKGTNLRTNEHVAIKSVERKASSLKNEIKICNHLAI